MASRFPCLFKMTGISFQDVGIEVISSPEATANPERALRGYLHGPAPEALVQGVERLHEPGVARGFGLEQVALPLRGVTDLAEHHASLLVLVVGLSMRSRSSGAAINPSSSG